MHEGTGENRDRSVFLLSLGCSKNTVDSEVMLALLQEEGFRWVESPEEATHLVVNTCGFIDQAKEEAVDSIMELARVKESRAGEGDRARPVLIVTGCMAQLYARELQEEIPEIDVLMGNGDLRLVREAVRGRASGVLERSLLRGEAYPEYPPRRELISSPGSAYLKISEGCGRRCSFCLIPAIRGPLRSRSMESILAEAGDLEDQGVRELILVSQDTLGYGRDLSGKPALAGLVSRLLERTGFPWIRLLYLSPQRELLELLPLFEDRRLLPYFDVPVQHASQGVLRAMGRSGDGESYRRLFDTIRERVPRAVLRTTFLVGFPGEGEAEHGELLELVRTVRFNHVGVFMFSPQEGTPAFAMKATVHEKTALRRRNRILELQQDVSRGLLAGEVGSDLEVLVEERGEEGTAFGRSYHFAPEVDGLFVLSGAAGAKPGDLVRARVTRSEVYDLYGTCEGTAPARSTGSARSSSPASTGFRNGGGGRCSVSAPPGSST
jgi:ribosomal protein S12 methylthiotransferase